MGLGHIVQLSRRFDIFDAERSYDRDLFKAGLFPPLPVCGDDLVWGFAFTREARDAELEELPIVEVPRTGRLLCALRLENRAGRYSPEEQYSIYKLAVELGSDEDRKSISLAASGNPGFFSRMERYKRLPDYLAVGINEGRLDIGTAEKVTGLPETACRRVIAKDALSFSQVRRFLIYLDEIRRRDRLEEEQTVSLTGELLASKDPIGGISKIRNPALAELTRKFESVRDRYTGHTGIRLEAPPHFEGDSFTVSFSFATKLEFLKKTRTLEKLEDGCEELEELL